MLLRNTLSLVELQDYENSKLFERTVCLVMARIAGKECGKDLVDAAKQISSLVDKNGVEWPENLVKYAEEYRGPAGYVLPLGRRTCTVNAKHPAFQHRLSVKDTDVSAGTFFSAI